LSKIHNNTVRFRIKAPQNRQKQAKKGAIRMETFGKWIKKLRQEKHIGLWRCAGYAGIGGEALRLIKTGKTNPANCKASTLYGLAGILEVDPAELIGRAVHQDEALVKLLRFGAKWREEEREYSEDCYLRYLAKSNGFRKAEIVTACQAKRADK
jgi:transcriptional regulator with XRE-family HTH domain